MMNRQDIYLEAYDWAVTVYYFVAAHDVYAVMSHLKRIGCKGEDLSKSWLNLTSGKEDTGLTYSDYQGRRSVIVVGKASSYGEFMNSLSHEIHHLSVHIAEANGLDLKGEEVCYIDGRATQKVFESPVYPI